VQYRVVRMPNMLPGFGIFFKTSVYLLQTPHSNVSMSPQVLVAYRSGSLELLEGLVNLNEKRGPKVRKLSSLVQDYKTLTVKIGVIHGNSCANPNVKGHFSQV
jgi:hypothetical protein